MKTEDIILRYSGRGMDRLRPYLHDGFCREAAEVLLSLTRGRILLTTGFYVADHAETDGPVGTLFLAKALNSLGFDCTIVTDEYCRGLFEPESIDVEYAPISAEREHYIGLLDKYRPTAMISVERCGVNSEGDYANMRGVSIAEHTAKLDLMFEEGSRRGIVTFGIGDGGNEIGMGNFSDVIRRELSIVPCTVRVEYPVIATVSNWGCYGLCAELQRLSGVEVMPCAYDVEAYLKRIVSSGCIDGVTHRQEPTVDGFPYGSESETVGELMRL